MSHLSSALWLNNRSAALMEMGNFTLAVATLSKGLDVSREASELIDENQILHPPLPTKTSLDDCMRRMMEPNSYRDDDDEFCEFSSFQTAEFLYQHPIHIQEGSIGTCKESCATVSAAIIFNLALAHQMSALVDSFDYSVTKTMNLHKAASLYELAYNLQRDELGSLNPLFMLATVNNMAMIYRKLDRLDKAGSLFQHLLSILMFLIDCGERDVISGFEGFFHNASHLSSLPCLAPAA